MDFNITCKHASIEAFDYKQVSLEVVGASTEDILNQICVEDAVKHYGNGEVLSCITSSSIVYHTHICDLLEEIGIEAVKEYFNLVEKENV